MRTLTRVRFLRPAISALTGGLFSAASVALYRVHDLASLSAVFRHVARDWYELPVFLLVACPIFFALQRRETDPGDPVTD